MLSSERKHILAPTRSCRGCTSNVISLQSTSLIRGKTFPGSRNQCEQLPFNPLPSSEGRRQSAILSPRKATLQSTSLIRGKTKRSIRKKCACILQSTSLIRGKTLTLPPVHSPTILQLVLCQDLAQVKMRNLSSS